MTIPVRTRIGHCFRGWLAWLCAGALAPSIGAAERWLQVSSQHFEMLSLASEKESRRILGELERFRENVLAIFPTRDAREPRVTIYLFPSMSSFKPYRPLYQGKPKEVAGYFINGRDEVVMAMTTENDPDALEDPAEIIFHEYLHLLLHTRELPLPPWLDEGLADVFSTFHVEGKFGEFGRPKELYVAMLQTSALMPLRQLLNVDHDSADYNEETRASMFYAQAWALTHYLLCGADKGNSEKLSRYLATLDRTKGDPRVEFAKIFGDDFPQLEHELRAYLDGGRYYQRRAPLRPIDETQFKVRVATPFERDLGLVNLRYRVHRSGDAALTLLHLAQQQPESPRPHEVLAMIAAEEGEWSKAFDYWRRAVELKSDNAFVYVQVARGELGHLRPDDFDTRLSDEIAADLQRWLDHALTLRPGYSDAIEALAQVEARAPTLRVPGINKVQQAVAHLKEPASTLLALAIIRWRAKDIPTCLHIIDAILESSRASPQVKAVAGLLRLRATSEAKTGTPDFLRVPQPAKEAATR